MRPGLRIDLQPSFCIIGALLVLVLPLRLILSWLTAAAVHEACHILAIRLCGGQIREICIGHSGATIEMEPMSPGKEGICALAGPAGGILLLSLFQWIPYVSLFALLQSVYNLLPIYPLDGGRALRCFSVRMTDGQTAERICGFVASLAKTALLILGILCLCRWNLGIPVLLVAVLLILWPLFGKIPCKRSPLGLQ